MNINKIFKVLNCNLEISQDIVIDYITNPSKKSRNSVMFVNDPTLFDLGLGGIYDVMEDCLILISPEVYELNKSLIPSIPEYEKSGKRLHNYIITVPDPKYAIYKIVKELNIRDLYGLQPRSDYHSILEKSEIVSKTAKIYNSIVGKDCSFHHNSFVGFEDFCPIKDPETGGLVMFPQLGNVIVGDRVSFHIGTIVGRGALGSTIIGDDTKIDSYCQIGHNCNIGKRCIIAAGSIISGSSTIGNDTALGVGVKVCNGVKIGEGVLVGAGAVVTKDIPDYWRVAGVPAKKIGDNSSTDWRVDHAFG
jgi:UDP-3-O-[3-hydroxymyristoyl] glucosamine N-acyltransferase